jgi:hypothetical protein
MKLNEALQSVRFHYSNYKHDPNPKVKVLDYEYPGRSGQKTYGARRDLLGWNTNYFENKEEASRSIDEIDSFARLLASNNKEKYERVKIFFPEQAAFLRRYIREHIKGIKVKKDDGLWHKTTYDELEKLHKESF